MIVQNLIIYYQYGYLTLCYLAQLFCIIRSMLYVEAVQKQRCRQIGSLINPRLVWPLQVLSAHDVKPLPPVKREGIIFYVYSPDNSTKWNRYMKEVKRNVESVLLHEPNAGSLVLLKRRPTLHQLQTMIFLFRLFDYSP